MATAGAASPASPRRRNDLVGDLFYRYALVVAWLAVIALFSILRPRTFATWADATTILGSQSVLVVLTLGLILPLTVGEFDLSVGSNLAFSSVTLGVLNVNHHWPIAAAVVGALVAGTGIGVINGLM